MRTLRRPRHPSSEAWSFFGGFETQAFYLVVFFVVFVENIAINQSNALIRKKRQDLWLSQACDRPTRRSDSLAILLSASNGQVDLALKLAS